MSAGRPLSPFGEMPVLVAKGPKGDPGPATQLAIGTVSSVPPGDPATVTISGVAPSQILSFEIPEGEAGTYYNYIRVTSGHVSQDKELIIADTAAGSFVVTLPPTPVLGTQVIIADGDDWAVNNLTVNRNGSTIKDIAEDYILSIGGLRVEFVYDGNTWQVFTQVSADNWPAVADAALVSYTPAGTGAVATTVQSKLREWVSVKDFGAVGDGVTDDTVAVQACWDFCRTNNRTAWVPAGVYRIGQTNIAYGMSIVGEAGATFKLLDNQPTFTRMLTTQNNLWSATSPTDDSPVLTIRGITLDGNRVNQGTYTGFEKEQQSMLFLSGGPGGLAGRDRLRAVVDSCVFKESCSDGTAVWHDVDVSIGNCFYWNCFRGSVVIIGGNNITRVTNIHAGGDVHNSFFQAEQENTIGGELTLTNSTFEPLRDNDQSGDGADFGFQAGSKVTVSNCVFDAGLTALNGVNGTTTFLFSNCVFRQLTGSDNLVRYGQTTFNNCKFVNTLANTTGRMIRYRHFAATGLRLSFTGCEFDSEFDPLTYLAAITITNVTEVSNGVFEFTTGVAHGFPAPGNFTADCVLISGLTEASYNKWYWLSSTPTSTTFRVNVTEYVGAPALGATPTVRLLSTTYMPAAIHCADRQDASNTIAISECFFTNKIGAALYNELGNHVLSNFSNNRVESVRGLYQRSEASFPHFAYIGKNSMRCPAFWLYTQGNITLNFVLDGLEIPARFGYVRVVLTNPAASEVAGKVRLVSNRAKPNNSQQRLTWIEYQYSIASIGSPTVYSTNGTAWFAQTTTTLRGVTGSRPALTSVDQGQMYLDNTLDADGKPIWWNGTAWVDATGATV